jgi:negative regulator of flagellin synthesis FlgM
MRIAESHLQDVLSRALQASGQIRQTGAAGPGRGAEAEADSLELSPGARRAAEIVEWLKTLPQVRQERVAELSRRIASGEYRVPADEIVDMLLGGEVE